MAEYIDRERVIQEIKDMDNCGCITRSVNHVCENMRSIPTADVIERSKINKAIEEIMDIDWHKIMWKYDDVEIGFKSEVEEILKRNLEGK